MAFNFNKDLLMAGSGAGAGLAGLFNKWKNPSDSAMTEMEGIPDMLKGYMNPYIEGGRGAMSRLQGEYGNLLSNPGKSLNDMGSGYHESPGFQFALKQAMQSARNSAASGGMAGSPQHEQQSMETATGLADQDYGNYISNAMKMYGMGLSGEEGMMNQGFNASKDLSESTGNMSLQKALMQYLSTQNENLYNQDMWKGIGGGIGSLASYFMMK